MDLKTAILIIATTFLTNFARVDLLTMLKRMAPAHKLRQIRSKTEIKVEFDVQCLKCLLSLF